MSNFTLMPWAPSQWTDSLGNILEMGILYFYEAGTLIPKTTYKKADGSEANTNPVILDAAGRARVWLINNEAYDIIVHNQNDDFEYSILGVIVTTGTGGGGTTLFQDSPSVAWSTVTVGGNVYNVATVQPSAVLDYKVKADGTTGDEPGYLVQKVTDKLGNVFNVDGSGIKRVIIPLQDYLNKAGGGTVTGATTINDLTVVTFNMGPGAPGMLVIGPDGAATRQPIPEESGKVRVAAGDLLGYLGVKIQPGTGIEFNETTDGVNGKVIHISSTTEGEGAPLHEVMTGDGAGGILSSPDFTAVGGAVQGQTFRANATGEAVTAPNGSMVAQDIAEVTLGAWGGESAFFGKKGHNPSSNDGTISGLLVGEYLAGLYAPSGGNASIGTGSTRLAVYDEQAAIGVPFSAPALHQTDAVVLVGSSYSSTYHATICFFGTGTAFVVPAGGSLNKTIRLSNSSAASISVTGTATAFTLPPGTSRDLVWTEDSITPTVSKWY